MAALAAAGSLATVLREVRRHSSTFHRSTVSEEQKNQCEQTSKKIRKNLQQLLSTKFDDVSLLGLVVELLKTVLGGDFCPIAHTVFMKTSGDEIPLPCSYLALFISLTCDAETSSEIRDHVLQAIRFLANFVAQQDHQRFLRISSDLIEMIKHAFHSQEPLQTGFGGTLAKSKNGGLLLHMSTTSKKSSVVTGLLLVLERFSEVSLACSSNLFGTAMETVCELLQRWVVRENGGQDEAEALLKTACVLARLPDARIRVGRAVMEHASNGNAGMWSPSYCATLAHSIDSIVFPQGSDPSMEDNNNDHLWATHLAIASVDLVQMLSGNDGNELREVRMVALQLLAAVIQAKPSVIMDCDQQLFSSESSLAAEVYATAMGRVFASVFRVVPGTSEVLLAMLRQKATQSSESSESSQGRWKRLRTLNDPKNDAGVLPRSQKDLIRGWLEMIVNARDYPLAAVCIEGLGDRLQDASVSTERHYLLQVATARLDLLLETSDGGEAAMELLSIVLGRLRVDQLKNYPTFQEGVSRLLGVDRTLSARFLDTAMSSMGVISGERSQRLLQIVFANDRRGDAVCVSLFRRNPELLQQWVRKLLDNIPESVQSNLSGTISQWSRLKTLLVEHEIDTSPLVVLIPRMFVLLGRQIADTDLRVVMVEVVAETIRHANAADAAFEEQSISAFLLMLMDDDVAVRNAVAREIGCLLSGFGDIGNGGGIKALAVCFRHESDADNVRSLMMHLDRLLEEPKNNAYRRTALISVGSIGSSARLESRDSHGIILGLVQWSLHALSSQWVSADDCYPGIMERTTALEQFRRIAVAQGMKWDHMNFVYSKGAPQTPFGILRAQNGGVDRTRVHPSSGSAIRKLFDTVKDGLYPRLFAMLLRGPHATEDMRKFTADVFGDLTSDRVTAFISDGLSSVLPVCLVRLEVDLLKKLAAQLYPNDGVKALLAQNYRTWAPVVVQLLREQTDETKSKLSKIQDLLTEKVALTELLKLGTKSVLKKLVLELTKDETIASLSTLARLKNKNSVHELVHEEFMYMMNLLSETIQEKRDDTSGSQKRLALRCAAKLIGLLQCKADEFVPKVMPTLASALAEPDLQLQACGTLDVLACKLTNDALSKNVSSFVVALVPCLSAKNSARSAASALRSSSSSSRSQSTTSSPEDAAVRLIRMLVKRVHPERGLHKRVLAEVHELLPDHPGLADVSTELEQLLGERSVHERLERLSSLVTRDSDEMRLLALRKLHPILQQMSGELMAMVLRRQAYHVSRLVGALLRTARSVGARLDDSSAETSVEEISLKCCECLGEIGAIDPALLSLDRLDQDRDFVDPCDPDSEMDMGNVRLAGWLLVQFLIDALRTAPDPGTHMKVGYCVQELVRFLGPLLVAPGNDDPKKDVGMAAPSSTATEEERKELAFLTESNHVGFLLRPFEKTNYTITANDPIVRRGRGGRTFFGPEVPFGSSVGEWVAYMATISQRQQSKMFASLVVLKQSDCATRMMLFLLPYVVQNVICVGTKEQIAEIHQEIIAILDDATSKAKADAITTEEIARDGSGGRVQLSVQAVFVLLDTLGRWVTKSSLLQAKRTVQPTMRLSPSKYKGEFDDKTRVALFLQSIPRRQMAEAALRCGSPSRALFYLESQLRLAHAFDIGGGGVGGPGSWREDQPVQFERDEIELLHMIHAAMEQDPDGLRGVVVLRTRHDGGPGTGFRLRRYEERRDVVSSDQDAQAQPRLMEQIHELESEARWDEALSCYEEALSRHEDGSVKDIDEAGLHEGQLRCLHRAGHLQLLVSVSDGKVARDPRLRPIVIPYALDALWRLGKWPELKTVLNSVDPSSSPLAMDEEKVALRLRKGAPGGMPAEYTEALAAALLAGSEKRDIRPFVRRARLRIIELLSAASMESYERAHPLLHRLQALVELEKGISAQIQPEEKWWTDRLKGTSPGLALQAELLAIRRAVNRMSTFEGGTTTRLRLEADSWLSLAKTAREFGDAAACESALIMLRRSVGTRTKEEGTLAWSSSWQSRIQQAELLRSRGALFNALKVLEPEIELLQVDSACPEPLAHARAKALLLATEMIVETGSSQGLAVLERYEKVLQWRPNWEKGTYALAKYCDYLLERVQESPEMKQQGSYRKSLLVRVLHTYGETLRLGSKHLFEALPRILTIWYSEGDRVTEAASEGRGEGDPLVVKSPSLGRGTGSTDTPASASRKKNPGSSGNSGGSMEMPNKVMTDLKRMLPAVVWYSALPQLVSRICHPDPDVWRITRDVLVKIIANFPSRSLWFVIGIHQSKVEARRLKAWELIKQFNNHGVETAAVSTTSIKQRQDMADRHVKSATEIFKALISLATSTNPKVNVPKFFENVPKYNGTEHYGLVLPTLSSLRATSAADESEPVALFSNVENYIQTMTSKERPKKIRFKGTDGVMGNFLCKHEGKGDLRKDSRLMDFNTVVNELFSRNVQARRRRLRLRTYAVVCLNEECGLLEWVENTQAFRKELIDVYQREMTVSVQNARAHLQTIQEEEAGLERRISRIARYRDEILSTFPPRFHKFFIQKFRDPSEWLTARLEFTRSAAVWSMVGHIVGLGDRHAENLLLDSATGECVHVDFDCLFDKGLTLAKPEIVPFRLTPNMVDGMGVAGVEGAFRGTCEVSLGVLRENKAILLSVLESFVVDPLVEWSKRREASSTSTEPEPSAEELRRVQLEQARSKFDAIAERLSGIVRDREVLAQVLKANRGGSIATKPITRRSLTRTSTTVAAATTTPNALTQAGTFETLPLSVPGQVERLIKEAIDEDKLSRMFVGWCPFL